MSEGTTTIALLGTGIMGAAMARNLLSADFVVNVWNRSKEKARPLASDGAIVADSPEGAAGGADVLLTMLADASVTEEVVGSGTLDALAPGAVWAQMGTVGIEGTERLADLARRSGVAYLDAPVLGTKGPAEAGELVVLASGPEEVRESVEAVFAAVGRRTLWVGPVGAGTRLKLVVNNYILGLLATLGETVALAERLGVNPNDLFGVLEGGPLDMPYARMKGEMMISGDYPASFPLALARKDVGLVLDAAEGLPMKVSEAAAALLDSAIASGYGEKDMSAIREAVRKPAS
ncbi:3-hydroxyisobutyrate dehydrogenase and related beta-hydroxyacid dehydrogenase [Rubrobacter radiotolerans]|uniref:3-hydroxyisobutyrate dehydrogenase and related beta-hydroxyacid dehydrogenase n=1 Tax=Rubrobacter radiotolerans TaxID=42256 RepID=A0A023X5D0_RUBRA|nr:NAD(P)-dependent oxidoreductase [Rubrobacter radiotolerans]AHY47662.1 3-hydroxyisobutyrate dehydrogenase and related beta-hydroxyacid dehydrogenase [Rubrobacter radiotolerans]MDX5895065.1 NAD(P)-dependent oxidoreductase [Rubrobacter radiotolerans]SMC07378.1 3-hydroxyisobutyrate dehydrogenase [Rubrobacter radiotolerans DSM 5868]